jgi:hypothetical protein
MKIKIFCAAFLLLMLNVVTSYAQGCPCGCGDPDNNCPLDTWVIVLAGGAFILAVRHLYSKQRVAAHG